MSGLPILTFHSLDDSGSVISFPPVRFARLMQELADAGWRGVALGEGRSATGGRTFAITFDDGYRNLLDEALPCLRALGFSATAFAVADRLGGDNRWSGPAGDDVPVLDLLDASGLRTLRAAGWEIGSHGSTHASLPGLDDERLEEELRASRERLEQAAEAPVRLLAYPYGHHDARVRAAASRHYAAAVGTELAIARDDDRADPFALPRIDAYYLRHRAGSPLFTSAAGRGYLLLRRWGRELRQRMD